MEEIRFEYDCDISTMHFHDELEILYVLSGRAGVIIEDGNYLLKLEDFTVFNPFEKHEIYREVGGHTLSAFISLRVLLQCDLGRISCCSALQQEKKIELNLLRVKLATVYKCWIGKEKARKITIISSIYNVLAILKRSFEVSPYSEEKTEIHSSNRMRQVVLYIHQHYTEDISLQAVAKETYMSTSHLSRKFEKMMGMHFSQYVRKLRLQKAAELLRSTDKSVIEIAEECGFSNSNTMTVNFKKMYGDIPSVYRYQQADEKNRDINEKNESANYIRLLKYARGEEELLYLNKQMLPPIIVKTDVCGRQDKCFTLRQNMSIDCGYAKEYFVENHGEILKKSVREIGFRYAFIQGILDDNMNIYHENLDGTMWFNYTYLDAVLDAICSTGALPWMEIGRTPEKLLKQKLMIFNDGYIQLPADLQKWERLVEEVLTHLIFRYGRENVVNWRFSLFPILYSSYGIFSIKEYLEYYCCTWNVIRKILPEVKIISGAFDSGYLVLDGKEMLVTFIEYCKKHQCMPDEIGLQIFSVDYSRLERKEIENRILKRTQGGLKEPVPPSSDEDCLRHHIEFVKQVLEENQMDQLPLSLVYWSSTMWDQDLGNDTCYKSAFIVKSCLENIGSVVCVNSNIMIDRQDERENFSNPFYGDLGNCNYMGIPKASYYAYYMLSRLMPTLLAQGNGYAVTSSEDRKDIRILLYNYGHYDLEMHLNKVLPREEQLTIDRYCGFQDPGVQSFQLYLKNLEEGDYDEEIYIINREHGSSYDIWRKIGAPQVLNKMQADYLIRASEPGYHYEKLRINKERETLISVALDVHEVRLICLAKR